MDSEVSGRKATQTLCDRCNLDKQKTEAGGSCEEAVKFYCESHDLFGCGTCMMLHHRNCQTVYIPDVAMSPDYENEFKKLGADLADLEKEFTDCLDQAELNIPEANRLYIDTTKDFLIFKNKIMDQLNKTSEEIEEKASEIRDRDIKANETIAEKCKKAKEEVQALKEESSFETEDDVGPKLFIKMKQTSNAVKKLHSTADELRSEIGIQLYEFQSDIDLEVNGSLGKLVVFETDEESEDDDEDVESGTDVSTEHSDDARSLSPNLSLSFGSMTSLENREQTSGQGHEESPLQVTYIRDLVTKAASDFEKIEISGIVLLPDDKLVIVDKGNQNVKLVNTKKNKVVHEIKVRYMIYNMWEPYGIAAVDGNQVAVTCPGRQKIQMVKVKKSLSEGSALKVNGRCYGIAYDTRQQVFIVTFAEPAKIEIVDKTGNTIRVLVSVMEAQHLFEHPDYVVLTKDGQKIYVSDSENSTVTRLNLFDDVTSVSAYNPGAVFDPHGITVDNIGRVYVCDASHDNLVCLTDECELIQILLDGKKTFPTCIIYNEADDSFYMSTSLEKIVVFRVMSAT